ncbi:MAG: GNAT family N-acetyltransferase [Desulfovibrionaceae bacterium]|nr:GNAT family N-acetyltransferase [Desulfovibrionaceae bacterium]
MRTIDISQVSTAPEIALCADIWLQASILAHDFIAPDFWRNNRNAMKEHYLPASTIYAAKKQAVIVGFAAVYQDSLAALFVSPEWWNKGIGSKLLRHAQMAHSKLSLNVYTKNSGAIRFYQKYGFSVLNEQICSHTGEPELRMGWRKKEDENCKFRAG